MSGAEKTSTDIFAAERESINAIEDAAGYCRTLWVAFIGYAGALFVLVSSTTHEALLRETPVTLPLFDVESGIPLVLFYVVAPILLVLFHFNLLLKLHDLRVRVRSLMRVLSNTSDGLPLEFRERSRRQFTSFDYALVESGLVEKRERLLLRSVTNTTVFVMPVLLLLFIQLQFLPYHDWRISWVHRGLIISDLFLTSYVQTWLAQPSTFFRRRNWKITLPSLASLWRSKFFRIRRLTSANYAPLIWYAGFKRVARWRTPMFAVPVLVSVFVLAFPGERQDVFWRAAWQLTQLKTNEFSALAGEDLAERFGIHRSLYLADRSLWAVEPSDTLLKELDHEHIGIAVSHNISDMSPQLLMTVLRIRRAALSVRGRNLSYANFEGSTLIAADFSPSLTAQMGKALDEEPADRPANRTDITGASFSRADLRSARLPYVDGIQANFTDAKLQNAVLSAGSLQTAYFFNAQLQSADMRGAQLQGASLPFAKLWGADLSNSELQDADLYQAELQVAALTSAGLEGAHLNEAKLHGTDLSNARLRWAELQKAELQGANLNGARMQHAKGPMDLSLANLAEVKIAHDNLDQPAATIAKQLPIHLRDRFLQRITLLEREMVAKGQLSDATGNDVWGSRPDLQVSGIKWVSPDAHDYYAVRWVELLAALSCNGGTERPANWDTTPYTTFINLIQYLFGAETLTPFDVALVRALLNNDCATKHLSDQRMRRFMEVVTKSPK